jgi:hypothetical protein
MVAICEMTLMLTERIKEALETLGALTAEKKSLLCTINHKPIFLMMPKSADF